MELKDLIGLTFIQVRQLCDNKLRICRKDGNEYVVTRDFNPDRINLEMVNEKVTKAWRG